MATNRPDMSPDPGGARDLSGQFDVLIENSKAMEELLRQQATTMQQMLDMTRLSMAGGAHQEVAGHVTGMQYQQQMRTDVLKSLSRGAGMPHDVTFGMTKMSGMQALTSVQNLQAYAAQWLGERIAGGKLPGLGSERARRRLGEPGTLYEEHDAHAATAGQPQPGAPATSQPGGTQWQPLGPPGWDVAGAPGCG